MRGKEASVPPREAGGASPETRTSKEVRNQTSPCDNCLQWRVHTTAAHAPTLRSNHRDSAARAARCEIVPSLPPYIRMVAVPEQLVAQSVHRSP